MRVGARGLGNDPPGQNEKLPVVAAAGHNRPFTNVCFREVEKRVQALAREFDPASASSDETEAWAKHVSVANMPRLGFASERAPAAGLLALVAFCDGRR